MFLEEGLESVEELTFSSHMLRKQHKTGDHSEFLKVTVRRYCFEGSISLAGKFKNPRLINRNAIIQNRLICEIVRYLVIHNERVRLSIVTL